MTTIRLRDFENDKRRITWKLNGMFLNVFYHTKEQGIVRLDRFFFTVMSPGGDTRTALINVLKKVEKHYGIELLKEYEPFQLN